MGQVTTATAGAPVEGAKVQTWIRNNNGGWNAGPGRHDRQERSVLRRRCRATARTWPSSRTRTRSSPPPTTPTPAASAATPACHEQVVFFTDRSLYRPGQTIHFKGIVIRVDQGKDNYETVAEPRT